MNECDRCIEDGKILAKAPIKKEYLVKNLITTDEAIELPHKDVFNCIEKSQTSKITLENVTKKQRKKVYLRITIKLKF